MFSRRILSFYSVQKELRPSFCRKMRESTYNVDSSVISCLDSVPHMTSKTAPRKNEIWSMEFKWKAWIILVKAFSVKSPDMNDVYDFLKSLVVVPLQIRVPWRLLRLYAKNPEHCSWFDCRILKDLVTFLLRKSFFGGPQAFLWKALSTSYFCLKKVRA